MTTADAADDYAVRAVFASVCNWGRWGPHDQQGTLNLIDDSVRRAALATVTRGRTASIARAIDPAFDTAAVLRMTTPADVADVTARDELTISPHGFSVTHLDALAHCFFDGMAWNGRTASEAVGERVGYGDAFALAQGILTRGVLLDVAGARGVSSLDVGDVVTPSDLEDAELLSGSRVRPGDAVFVRVGREDAERAGVDAMRRAGMSLETLRWLRERDVAVFSGDCVDRLPSPYPAYPDYFHQIALAGMGLVLLDNPDLEVLRQLSEDEGRSEFLLHAAPLPVVGATGSAVNPLVTF